MCSHRCAPMSNVCSEHSPEALQTALLRERTKRSEYEARKRAMIATIPEAHIQAETKAVLMSMVAKLNGEEHAGEPFLKPESSKRKRNKRVSAPKRMANPFSLGMSPDMSEVSINWKDIYRNPRQPLHIDVGCAKGVCIENLSKRDHRKNWNHLGVEIREDLLKDRIAAVANEMPSNLHYVSCNFATSVSDLLNTLQVGVVRLISFQFPDPWRRERHKKRLILQSSLIDSLARFLTEGALVYISSDCEHVAQKFAAELESSPYFELYNIQSVPATIESQAILHPICSDPETVLQEKDGWLAFNPLAEPSERELVCEMQWKRVWRCIYVRNERRSRS